MYSIYDHLLLFATLIIYAYNIDTYRTMLVLLVCCLPFSLSFEYIYSKFFKCIIHLPPSPWKKSKNGLDFRCYYHSHRIMYSTEGATSIISNSSVKSRATLTQLIYRNKLLLWISWTLHVFSLSRFLVSKVYDNWSRNKLTKF
jgi:hypothetical protein